MSSALNKVQHMFYELIHMKGINIRLRVVSVIICIFLSKMLIAFLPVAYGKIVDSLAPINHHIHIHSPLFLIAIYGLLRFLAPTINNLEKNLLTKIVTKIKADVFMNTLGHIHKLPHDFHLASTSGMLLQSLRLGSEAAGNILFAILFSIAPKILEIIITLIICCKYLSYDLLLSIFFIMLIYFMLTFYVTNWRLDLVKQINGMSKKISSLTIESFINFELIKCYSDRSHLLRIKNEWSKQVNLINNMTFLLFILRACQELIMSLAFIIVLWISSNKVNSQYITIGTFVMIISYLSQLLNPFEELVKEQDDIRHQLADLNEVERLKEIPLPVTRQLNLPTLVIKQGKISFEAVNFNYRNNQQLLNTLNFTVQPGSLTVITGPSGVGKSTLLRLLLGFHEISHGAICIDDINIKNVDIDSLRKSIGYVSQESSLFNNSILSNITYSAQDVDFREVEEICKKFHLHDFIMQLPDKYETIIGERGVCLSGGERQRISLARALIRCPKILLLDEINSSLDEANEKLIVKALHLFRGSSTIVTVMHRIPACLNPDKIIFLEKNYISEYSSAEELEMARMPVAFVY